MNGPQHYAEAERLAEVAASPAGAAMKVDGFDCAVLAQVHATLALIAATANVSRYDRDGFGSALVDPPGNDWKKPDEASWAEVLR